VSVHVDPDDPTVIAGDRVTRIAWEFSLWRKSAIWVSVKMAGERQINLFLKFRNAHGRTCVLSSETDIRQLYLVKCVIVYGPKGQIVCTAFMGTIETVLRWADMFAIFAVRFGMHQLKAIYAQGINSGASESMR
jgi:hypothetical protein